MARGNPGKLVQWTNNAGQTKYGIAYDKEQNEAFLKVQKLFIRHTLEDFVTKETDPDTGKNVVGLVAINKLFLIGYVD